jgi:hypothetical protein
MTRVVLASRPFVRMAARLVRRPLTRTALLLAPFAMSAACGYFNSLYNANRSFDEARSAERQGDSNAAVVAYNVGVELPRSR